MHGYDQYMGRVDLSDQMKVSYQLDRKANFIFIWEFFLVFLILVYVYSIW